MHYSSKPGGLAPVDFLLEIMGIKIDYNQLFLSKQGLEGHNSKNGEIDVFADHFQVILMGFLNTPLYKSYTFKLVLKKWCSLFQVDSLPNSNKKLSSKPRVLAL
jgi:hypothetical protein